MADLKAFVQSQMAQRLAAGTVDNLARKQKWLDELTKLFDFVREELERAGFPSSNITTTKRPIQEEQLGTYEVPGLQISLPAGGVVSFSPVATFIIGGYGRVDVNGSAKGVIKLIATFSEDDPLDDEDVSYERNWAWGVYPRQGLAGAFKLDSDGLAKLLTMVSSAD